MAFFRPFINENMRTRSSFLRILLFFEFIFAFLIKINAVSEIAFEITILMNNKHIVIQNSETLCLERINKMYFF